MKGIAIKFAVFIVSILLYSCAAHNKADDNNNIQFSQLQANSLSSETAQRFLFVSNQDGDREIYTVGLDGTNLTQLTHNNRDDYSASWSPSGDKILFTSNRDNGNTEVYMMNADGSQQINVSQSPGFDGRARWSNDGDTIVFNSDRNGAEALYLFSLASHEIRYLPIDELVFTAEPEWSPDNQWLAFQGFNQANKSDIWLINISTGKAQQLTDNPKSEDSRVSWSPNGRKLAYHSRRDHQYNIYIYDLDLNKESQITHLASSDIEPIWSHDGKQLLFLSMRGRFGRTQLCIMQEDGSQQRCLTDEHHQTADAQWLDNDQGILHSNWFGMRYPNILLLDLKTTTLKVVSPAKGYQTQSQLKPK